jgi:hypothetical protein
MDRLTLARLDDDDRLRISSIPSPERLRDEKRRGHAVTTPIARHLASYPQHFRSSTANEMSALSEIIHQLNHLYSAKVLHNDVYNSKNRIKSNVRSMVEHLFLVIKQILAFSMFLIADWQKTCRSSKPYARSPICI